MLHAYQQHLRDLHRAPTTIRLRTHYVRLYLTHHDPQLATTDLLSRWVHAHGWSPATVQSGVASLRSFFHWAHKAGLVSSDPAADLPQPRQPRVKARIATDVQIAAGLLKTRTVQHEAWIRLGAECGLRVHEIAKVHHDDIDGEWLTVVGKGQQVRTVWLSARLRDVLDRCPRRHGWLFPGKSGTPVHPSTVWRAVRDLVDVNTHALRHRAGTTVYRAGGNDLRLAQEFLGHASPTTTARYVHVERDQLRRAGESTALAAA